MSTSTTNALEESSLYPLWKYVTIMERPKVVGGNCLWKCNFCGLEKNCSHFRLRHHLMREPRHGIAVCPNVKAHHLAEMQKLLDDASKKAQESRPKIVPLPTHSSFATSSSSSVGVGSSKTKINPFEDMEHQIQSRKRKSKSGALEKAFNLATHDELHSEIARMFYSGGLPFHLARNPHYIRSFSFAASHDINGYIPPGYNLLRTTLLKKERANIERLLEPIKSSWNPKGVTIVSDGWSDPQRRPLINFMAVNEGGPMFLKAYNCQGKFKDKYFISNLIREVIIVVGPSNVVQVITDNAPVCKSAGLLIETQFPHIFWTPCVVHTLNLALKNICEAKNTLANEVTYEECNWIADVLAEANSIKNFITNHSMRLSIFNDHASLKMLSYAETRFASSIIMLKRFKVLKHSLQSMVISSQWASYKEDDVAKAGDVKDIILNDLWWDNVEYILSFTEPIYDMLRRTDKDEPCLHLIYEMWDAMIEKVKHAIYRHEKKKDDESSSFYGVVHEILVDRWEKNNTPLHCLAHSLNPRYYSSKWLQEVPGRVAPHQDAEIAREREKCLKIYFESTIERRDVNVEFAKFSACLQDFSSGDSMEDRAYMEPNVWWVVHGSTTPKIQSLALKLLGQPFSSSCCERNWSTYSFVHSLKRNQMTPPRAEDLVFCHSNLRLLSRKTPSYNEGNNKMWDVGGDMFDSLEDEGAGILEVANLSLDEPELEAMLFTDGGGDLDGDMDDDEVLEVDEPY